MGNWAETEEAYFGRNNLQNGCPKGFILYRIWYGNKIVYIGRTRQPLQARIHGHMFASPMHRAIDIHNVTKIEYTMLSTEADMNLYEIYFINLWKPALNVDDKAGDDLTAFLPDLRWQQFIPTNWEKWKEKIGQNELRGYYKSRSDKIADEIFVD